MNDFQVLKSSSCQRIEWKRVLPGAAQVATLINRFVQHCYELDVVRPSIQLKDAQQHRRRSKPKLKPETR